MSDLEDGYCLAKSKPLNTYYLAKEMHDSMKAAWRVMLVAINEKRDELS